jgi:hypothetical protein
MARYEHLPIDKQALDPASHLERVLMGFSSTAPGFATQSIDLKR